MDKEILRVQFLKVGWRTLWDLKLGDSEKTILTQNAEHVGLMWRPLSLLDLVADIVKSAVHLYSLRAPHETIRQT